MIETILGEGFRGGESKLRLDGSHFIMVLVFSQSGFLEEIYFWQLRHRLVVCVDGAGGICAWL